MLERAAAYVEPASQAFILRCDTPLRSSRLLRTGFFRHGGSTTDPPSWWPLYLDAVRQIPQAPDRLCPALRPDTHISMTGTRHPLPTSFAAPSVNKLASSRPYSLRRSTRLQRERVSGDEAKDEEEDEDHDDENGQGIEEEQQEEPEQDDIYKTKDPYGLWGTGTHELLQGAGASSDTGEPTIQGIEPSTGAGELERSLETPSLEAVVDVGLFGDLPQSAKSLHDQVGDLLHRTRHGLPPAKEQYQKLWLAFIALPDQEEHASRVMSYLATSANHRDWIRAYSAFKMMPQEGRTEEDYNVAVDIAARLRRIPQVEQLCTEARQQQKASLCQQTALLYLLRLGLWKTAARLWVLSFGEKSHLHPSSGIPYVQQTSLQLFDNSLEMPTILLKLCERVKGSAPRLDAQTRETLMWIARGLGWRVVNSAQTMSHITLKGLLRVFDGLRQLDLLDQAHYYSAMRILASPNIVHRPRHDLAMALYRNSRFHFPNRRIKPHTMSGLVSLCCRAGESYEAFRYLFTEIEDHIENGLPTSNDYFFALTAMSRRGNVEAVSELYKQYLAHHTQLEKPSHVVPALYVHAVSGDVAATEKAFSSLWANYGLKPNTACWNVLILAHARSDDPQNAFTVFEKMRSADIEADAHSYDTLMTVCATRVDVSHLLSLVQQATDSGVANIPFMLRKLVKLYCVSGEIENAETLVANLGEFKIKGSIVPVWNELLKYHAFREDLAAVHEIQQQMKTAEVEPDEESYGCIFHTLIQKRQTTDALKILRSLHLNSPIAATPFLYSMVLIGFEREHNRDMVSIVYQEIQERYPRAGPTANLTMLKALSKSGVSKSIASYKTNRAPKSPGDRLRVDLTAALQFLESLDTDDAQSQVGIAASGIQPGFSRADLRNTMPSKYAIHVAESLAHHGKPEQAAIVMDWADKVVVAKGAQRSESVRMLSARLLVARERERWDEVDQLWNQVIQEGVVSSLPISFLRNVDGELDLGDPLAGTITFMNQISTRLLALKATILPARRLALMVPLSRYLYSLARQNRQATMNRVVDMFQNLGFRLSGSNWNVYVQSLCVSGFKQHKFQAFSIYANVLFPFMPSYKGLDNGRWKDPIAFKATPGRDRDRMPSISYRLLTIVNPEITPPSYITVVNLARVLLDFEAMSRAGDGYFINKIQDRFPEAYQRILKMPQLPDRVQRVILLQKRPHMPEQSVLNPEITPEGVLGSKSLLASMSPDRMGWATKLLDRPSDSADVSVSAAEKDLDLAEEAFGEIPRESMFIDVDERGETKEEQHERVSKTELEYLSRIDESRKQVRQPSLVADDQTGDPVHRPFWERDYIRQDVVDELQEPTRTQSSANDQIIHAKFGHPGAGLEDSQESQAPQAADGLGEQDTVAVREAFAGDEAGYDPIDALSSGDNTQGVRSSNQQRMRARDRQWMRESLKRTDSKTSMRTASRQRGSGNTRNKKLIEDGSTLDAVFDDKASMRRVVRPTFDLQSRAELDTATGMSRASMKVGLQKLRRAKSAEMRDEQPNEGIDTAATATDKEAQQNDESIEALDRPGKTAPPPMKHYATLYRRDLPPKSGDYIDSNFARAKMQRKERRILQKYRDKVAMREAQAADSPAQQGEVPVAERLGLPMYVGEQQRQADVQKEIGQRAQWLQDAKASQAQRMKGRLSYTAGGNMTGNRAVGSDDTATAWRRRGKGQMASLQASLAVGRERSGVYTQLGDGARMPLLDASLAKLRSKERVVAERVESRRAKERKESVAPGGVQEVEGFWREMFPTSVGQFTDLARKEEGGDEREKAKGSG